MHPKEQIYDEKISPLVQEIIKICKNNNMDMYLDVNIGENSNDYCNTMIADIHNKYKALCALSQCFEGENINIDKFIFWLNKNYQPNMSSMCMDAIFKNGEWRTKGLNGDTNENT